MVHMLLLQLDYHKYHTLAPTHRPICQIHRRLAIMIYQAHISETTTSLDTPVFSSSAGETHSHLETEGSSSGLNPTVEQQHYSSNLQRTTAADTRPGTAGSGWSMASSVHHRRALPTPNDSVTIVNAITPTIFRDTEEDTNDDEAHSTQDPPKERSGDTEWASWITTIRGPPNADPGYIGTTGPHAKHIELGAAKAAKSFSRDLEVVLVSGAVRFRVLHLIMLRCFFSRGALSSSLPSTIMSSTSTISPNSKRKRSMKTCTENDEEDAEDSKLELELASEDANCQTSSKASPSKKARSSDVTGNSSRKAKSPYTPKSQKSTKPPATDPRTWRNSQVHQDSKINAGNSREQYRLYSGDLKHLEKEITPAGKYIAYLYNEREVERIAWKKHGSPEGWDAYLQKLRVCHNNSTKERKNPFREPGDHSPGVSPLSTISLSLSLPLDVARLKAKFPQPWIFSACWEDLQPRGYCAGRGAEEYLELALSNISEGRLQLPPRPNNLLPSSSSMDQLRDTLKRAPRPTESSDDDTPTGMRSEEDNYGDVSWYWAPIYLDEVNKALITVINEHGVGEVGWSTARWEVRDKVAYTYAKMVVIVAGLMEQAFGWMTIAAPSPRGANKFFMSRA
ncbi:hypothetical protein HWV62_401 [Athelia sp. TMB]|nr:hypothetical protein HWV62_401 [Athelia sp. TMB]